LWFHLCLLRKKKELSGVGPLYILFLFRHIDHVGNCFSLKNQRNETMNEQTKGPHCRGPVRQQLTLVRPKPQVPNYDHPFVYEYESLKIFSSPDKIHNPAWRCWNRS
jgi:hypothetical protein